MKIKRGDRREKLLIFLSFIVCSLFLLSFVSAIWPFSSGGTTTPPKVTGPIPQDGLFGKLVQYLGWGDTYVQVAISFMVVLILVFGIYDIFTLVSIFTRPWLVAMIAIFVGLLASFTGWIRAIATFLFKIAALMGAFGIFIEMAVVFVIWIGLVFGLPKAQVWAVKRRSMQKEIVALNKAGDIKAGMTTMEEIGKAAAKRKKLFP